MDELIEDLTDVDLTDSDRTNVEKIHDVVSLLMFANGDAKTPNYECVEFMLNLLYQQLRLMITGAEQSAQESGGNYAAFGNLLSPFSGRPEITARLIKHVYDRFITFNFSDNDESFGTFERLTEEEPNPDNSRPFKLFTDALVSMDDKLWPIINKCVEVDYIDPVKTQRSARLFKFTTEMTESVYREYYQARRCSLGFRSDQSCSNMFLKWIEFGDNSLHNVIILNFVGTEIIAQMVENARIIQEEEGEISTALFDTPLELAHYRSALRRNLGYQQNGNLLFGYIRQSEKEEN